MDFNYIDSNDVQEYYDNQKNYRIIDNNLNNEHGATVVYFSSNGLYYPNTYEVFCNIIKINDRYEWSKVENQFIGAKKIIFIRDIYKQWYLRGINKEINNFEKLAQFIKQEHTSGSLILVGASSGGYAATIIGMKLKADAVFSFSGQLTLEPILKEAKEKGVNRLVVEEYSKNKEYYNLKKQLETSDIDIFYFVCNYAEFDKEDIQIALESTKIHKFFFECDVHGVAFSSMILKKVLSTKNEKLIEISKQYDAKLINPRQFWSHFFSKSEFLIVVFLHMFRNFRKMPRYILNKIKEAL